MHGRLIPCVQVVATYIHTYILRTHQVTIMLPLVGLLLVALMPFSHARLCDDLSSKIKNDVIDSMLWPKSAQIATSGKLSPTWGSNVQGEVIPNGERMGGAEGMPLPLSRGLA